MRKEAYREVIHLLGTSPVPFSCHISSSLPRVVCFSTRSFSTFVTRILTIPPGGRRPAADDRRGGMREERGTHHEKQTKRAIKE